MKEVKKSTSEKNLKSKANNLKVAKTIVKPKIVKNFSTTTQMRTLKPRKKTKRKKWKIILATVAYSLIAIIVVGVGSIFVLNDFAMTTLLSNNSNRSFYIVESVMENAFDSRYFEMDIYFESKAISSQTPSFTTSTVMKAIHYDNNTYGYTAVENYDENTFNLFYKEGVLYFNVDGTDYKNKQNYATAQASFQPYILQYLDGHYIFPTTSGVLANKSQFESLKPSFIINSSPFYIGESFEINYETEKEIYKLDVNGNLKERTYIKTYEGFEFLINIKYTSINKAIVLEYPSDLNTY